MARTFGQKIYWFCCVIVVLLFHTACSARAPNAPDPKPAQEAAPEKAKKSTTDGSLPLQPGEYVTEKGWGRLQLTKQGDTLLFSIASVMGEDGCTLSGEVEDGRGIANDDETPAACAISLSQSEEGIEISASTPAECKGFCGYNAEFEGTYLTTKSGCSQNEIEQTRKAFKQLYDNKDYKPALAKLSPVLTNCLQTLEWEEEGGIRNDLAITQYKNGIYDECLETLDQYTEDAKKDDDSVVEQWTPALADRYLSIIKAARTNIALCSNKSTKK